MVLEGGYDLEALTYSTGATLAALIGENYRPETPSGGEIGSADGPCGPRTLGSPVNRTSGCNVNR